MPIPCTHIYARYSDNSLFNIQYYFRMMKAMELEFLSKAEKSPNYRKLVIGLAEEASERNVI